MKVLAIICILSLAFYSCGGMTSNSSYNSYNSYNSYAAADRQEKIVELVLGIGLIILIIYMLDGGKKNQSAIMKSWMGASVPQLIRSWGPPHEIVSDGAGGKIYIYTKAVDILLKPGTIKRKGTYGGGRYTENIEVKPAEYLKYDKVRMFWVNSQGIIYHWKWKGL